ncbi:MAG: SufS family cysteine desulfurase [Acidobacteria bacterium]|nr:SufS family cysteine desulfurase [Acidobacteriota bacterium]
MSTNTTSTSDRIPAETPGTAATPAPEAANASLPAFLPDPAVIAKLANEFFAALPGQTTVGLTPSLEAAAPSGAPQPSLAEFQSLPLSLVDATAVTPRTPGQVSQAAAPSPELPGSIPYFLHGSGSPLNVTPTLPSFHEVFAFPGVPHAQPSVGIPAPTPASAIPPAEAKIPSLPGAPVQVPPSVESAPALPGTSVPTSEKASPLQVAPSFPSLSQAFSFPGVPGAQPPSGIPAFPSSLPGTSLPHNIPETPAPGSSAYVEEGKNATPPGAAPVRVETFEFHPNLVPELGRSPRAFDPHMVRRDFPILQEQVNGRPLIWLDNAATTQKPNAVIDRLSYFYRHENSNIHRAAHTLAARATDAYEGAREKVRRFLNASSTREIVFVRGTTEGINLVAQSWGRRNVQKDDEIVITWLEHHANIVPWQQLCAETGARLRVAPVDDSGQIILEEYEKLLGPRTRLVAFSQVSNALGTVTPARQMIEIAHRYGARVLVDGAQSVSHMRADVQWLDCDFFVFSGHKIFAPTGIGVVFGKLDVLDSTPPWQGGGNMIADVTFEKTVYQAAPARFEAGTGNIADAVGLGAALDYVEEIGIETIARYEHDLLLYAMQEMKTIPGLHLIGTAQEKASVLSFVLDGFRTEDVGKALNQEGIAVRSGHHCAQPILRRFGLESTVRPSLAFYNTCEDVDALIAALRRIQAGSGHQGL